MSDVLVSPEETSALMDPTPAAGSAAGEFTFKQPPAFLGEREQHFDRATERLAGDLSKSLSRLLRRKVSFTFTDRAEKKLPVASSKTVRFTLGRGPAAPVIVLHEDLVPAAADLLLGAAEAGDERPLTPLERRVLNPIAESIREGLAREGLPCDPSLIVDAAEEGEEPVMMVLDAQIEFEERKGALSIGLPHLRARRMARPDVQEEKKASQAGGAAAAPAAPVTRRVDASRAAAILVDVDVVIPGGQMRLGEIRELAPGDVVRLDHREGEPIPVLVNGVPASHGRISARGQRRAVVLDTLPGISRAASVATTSDRKGREDR